MKALMKPILTIIIGIVLFIVGYSIGDQDSMKYLLIWIICGIPYGLPRIRFWIALRNGDLGTTAGVLALNFILAGLIGGFIYIWTMGKAIISVIAFFVNQKRDLPSETETNQGVE